MTGTRKARPALRTIVLATAVSAIAGVTVGGAPASALAGPWWQIGSEATPSYLSPGATGEVRIALSNLGDSEVNASSDPLTITNRLPGGLTAVAVTGQSNSSGQVKCPPGAPTSPSVTCTFAGAVYPYERLTITLQVKVDEPPGTVTSLPDDVSVEGGGAPPAVSTQQLAVSGQPVPFGIQDYELTPLSEDGTPETRAGAHPFQLTTTLTLNQVTGRQPAALPKDLSFRLPAGLIGNPTAVPRCNETDFDALVFQTNLCPPDTVVGVASVVAYEPILHEVIKTVPVFNLVPAEGEPARFGFEVVGKIPVIIGTSVRTGSDYAVVASVKNTTQTGALLSSQVTLWGVPADPRHDPVRGWECVAGGAYFTETGRPCPDNSETASQPFLTLPTSCATDPAAEPVISIAEADSWAEPGSFLGSEYEWIDSEGHALGFDGCSELPFSPTIDVTPERHTASAPTGLIVNVGVPQTTTLDAKKLAEADVRDTTVTLPAGVQLSPSAANALEACSQAQIGFTGLNTSSQTDEFTPAKPSCPEASKVGTVHIKTPLLTHELEGSVYLGQPAPNGEAGRNPFNSLIALYLVAEDPLSGVLVKLAGEGTINESTGQVSTSFRNTPQLPFEELSLQLFGGERASLSTPSFCGSYPTQAIFTPWSGTPPAQVSSPGEHFEVNGGAGGGGCPGAPLGFAPAFSAQSTNTAAAGFTHFTVEIARPDGQQQLSGLSMRLPQGIAALLSSVTPCAEPPVGMEWSCGETSLIGHSTAISGLGDYPVTLPGNVYLTSGYDGAPFGLLVQTRAQAGPFDLGNVNVRSRINVDPNTAQVTITTDPGPRGEGFPTMIRGIPAQIKKILVSVNREGFEFNPTNCAAMKIEGTLNGSEGAAAGVSSPFQVSGCQGLPFHPTLTAATIGHASKADGTSFIVKVASAGLGQANIAKVDLQLPKQLPSRLPTIQKACLARVFEANPAGCDEGSLIGTATIHTPVLKSPLSGPAYLVSHGNAAFPDVEFVLQGEGITLVLDGKTQIKNGITYSKFESAPDAPFTTFETVLPAGPHSALTADVPEKKKYDLCGETLMMPTTITAQNGVLIDKDTKIAIQGCGAVKAVKAKKLSKLAAALRACRGKYKHAKAKRAACERAARRRYAASKATHKKTKTADDHNGR
jgi:hypothetical protein